LDKNMMVKRLFYFIILYNFQSGNRIKL